MQIQTCFVFSKIEASRVGKYHTRIVETSRKVVDYHIVEHAGLGIFSLHVKIHIWYLVIERALRDFDLRRFLPHREQKRPHLGLCYREHIVLKEKSTDCNENHHNGKGFHYTEQRDARGLHGRKLEILAQIAEDHEGSQQHSQRECHRHHSESGVEKEFSNYRHFKALAYEVIDRLP